MLYLWLALAIIPWGLWFDFSGVMLQVFGLGAVVSYFCVEIAHEWQ